VLAEGGPGALNGVLAGAGSDALDGRHAPRLFPEILRGAHRVTPGRYGPISPGQYRCAMRRDRHDHEYARRGDA
jgi:hypothetical protein